MESRRGVAFLFYKVFLILELVVITAQFYFILELRFYSLYRPFVCRIPSPASLGSVCSHSVDFASNKTVINCFVSRSQFIMSI